MKRRAWGYRSRVREGRTLREGRALHGKRARHPCLALLWVFLSGPLISAAPLAGEAPAVLVGVVATGHVDPVLLATLQKQLASRLPAFAARLTFVTREAGFIEGELAGKIDELAALHPAVLVCLDFVAAQSAKARLRDSRLRIPIVFMAHTDPVLGNLIQSFAHPGDDITGVTTYRCIDAKMLEILVDTFPTRKRIGYLLDGSDGSIDEKQCAEHARTDAVRMHVELVGIDVSQKNFFSGTGERLRSLRLDAVLAPASAPVWQNRREAVRALSDARLPAIYENDIFLTEGGLMSYGPVRTDAIPQLAQSVSKILLGEPAGEIPVDQPTLFEFVINQRAPHFSEFGIRAATLRRADRVLE